MKSIFLSILFLLFGFSAYAQIKERVLLTGRVVSDSLDVENITIFNITANTSTVSNVNGNFSIKARETDTLYFQSLSFISKKYTLTEGDFLTNEFEIRLNVKINELDEVVVSPYTLTGNLKEDSKKIKVYGINTSNIDFKAKKIYSDSRFYSSPINTATPSVLAPTSFDFVRILGGIANLLGVVKDNSKKYAAERLEMKQERRQLEEVLSKSFSDHLYSRFSQTFFVSTLGLQKEEVANFITFAEPGYEKLAFFLKKENELAFIEYLVAKIAEFKRNKLPENTTNKNTE